MIRKIASGLMLSLFAGALVIGCGKADLSEGQAAWTKRAEEVKTKQAEVEAAYNQLSQTHQSMQVADMSAENKAKHEQGSQMLSAEETTLKSVSESLAAQDAALTAAVETGDQAQFDAAWQAASAAYDEATSKLESVSNNINNIKTLAESMMATPDTTATPADAPAADPNAPAADKDTTKKN